MNKNLIKQAKSFLRKCTRFGFSWSVSQFAIFIFPHKKTLEWFFRSCAKYTEKRYSYVIDKYKNYKEPQNTLPEDAPIYIFWLQGEAQMPPIVKACYESVKRHCEKHPIILMDINNVEEYVKIPDFLKEKVKKGIFGPNCFANVVRNKLLAERGGIWCDATIYLTKPIAICENFNKWGGVLCVKGH